MRITRTLLNFKKALSAKARCPQNPDKVPFAKMGPILPLKLKNRGKKNFFFVNDFFNIFLS